MSVEEKGCFGEVVTDAQPVSFHLIEIMRREMAGTMVSLGRGCLPGIERARLIESGVLRVGTVPAESLETYSGCGGVQLVAKVAAGPYGRRGHRWA
ncbi:hypothetical protein GCM10007304_46080 [Rhodococcoides trifolii]|uniref:Uncharacterized protein n=1 Tax=Rhodococcoides trifolii TaxID=908250 RepID=A0A917LIK5_9NOCA|nr:hypothetical protein [Rhodococcus trifolii]GGG27033.1 hypothetical protein GCM10007304_46080 [Rhodococcus trifolii]